MSWTVILENEKGEIITKLNRDFSNTHICDNTKNQSFQLLKYLDPYGDTVFNNMQMDDLIADLILLTQLGWNDKLTKDILELAQQCKNHPHLYLKFYGD